MLLGWFIFYWLNLYSYGLDIFKKLYLLLICYLIFLFIFSYVDLIMTLQLEDVEVSVEEAEKSQLVINLKEIADKICTSLKGYFRQWLLLFLLKCFIT